MPNVPTAWVRFHAPALALLLFVLCSGCAATSPQPTTPSLRTPDRAAHLGNTRTSQRTVPPSAREMRRAIESKLLAEYRVWEGVAYRYGGTTRSGVDCSAFVQHVYRDALAINLPRTTHQQVLTGREVRRDQIDTGDLIFFKTGPNKNHVGVYLSDGQFAHASSSRGVTISDIDGSYWKQRYWTARRLIQMPAATPDRPAVAAASPPLLRPDRRATSTTVHPRAPQKSRRTGW